MEELVHLARGDVQWREAPDPVLEGPGEALVRLVAPSPWRLAISTSPWPRVAHHFHLPAASATKG